MVTSIVITARISVTKSLSVLLLICFFPCSQRARQLNLGPFLSSYQARSGRSSSIPYLQPGNISERLKETVVICGLDAKNIDTHSMRIAGATLQAAAKHPDHYILFMGRWSSSAYLAYLHFAIESMHKAHLSSVDPSTFSMKELLRRFPAVKVA